MLNLLLSQKKPAILDRWQCLILESYPGDSSGFLRDEKDRFKNPVGHALHQDLNRFLEELIQGGFPEKTAPLLDYFIKMRSVQDFSPSQAVAFVTQLKRAVRENLTEEIREGAICGDLLAFESRLDQITLLAFETYIQCRELIFDIKTKQIKRGAVKLMDRLNRPVDKAWTKEDRNDGET